MFPSILRGNNIFLWSNNNNFDSLSMKAYAVYDDLFHEKFSKFQLKRTYHAHWCTCSITTKHILIGTKYIMPSTYLGNQDYSVVDGLFLGQWHLTTGIHILPHLEEAFGIHNS